MIEKNMEKIHAAGFDKFYNEEKIIPAVYEMNNKHLVLIKIK